MTDLVTPPTQGDGYARMLLGAIGTLLVGGGMALTWLIVTTWPVAFLAASSGLALVGYGASLLLACAFYDDVDVRSGPLGLPLVSVKPRRPRPPDQPPGSDSDQAA